MQRPQTTIIDQQQVESEREVTGWEAEQLLRKYGHQPQQFSSLPIVEPTQDQNLTFEEMLKVEEDKRRDLILKQQQRINGPKPVTFDGSRGYDSEIKYSQDEDSGFGFKVEITSDMKIPKY